MIHQEANCHKQQENVHLTYSDRQSTMITKFDTIEQLANGNPRQRHAYHTLQQHQIMEILTPFDPILAGTVPINIDIESSDLDIICAYQNGRDFREYLKLHFSGFHQFQLKECFVHNESSVIANFVINDWPIEIFGQIKPSRTQAAVIHMYVEYNLLSIHGEQFRQHIIQLKKQGLKTEPAFAQALGIKGDPYLELLKLYPA